MDNLVGTFFFDILDDWRGGYIREVLATSDKGDDKYEVSVPNRPDCPPEIVSGDFIRECLERAGNR